MKVKISDEESYWVVWQYPKKDVVFNQGDPDERIERHPIGESFCFIYDDTIQGEPKLVATGVAVCGTKDRFSRAEGRLLAFERAVDKISEVESEKYNRFWKTFYSRVPEKFVF
jgi:hypothetical protein